MIQLARWRSILLSLFVLFQLIYLPLANLIQLIPREMPPLPKEELDIGPQREGTASRYRIVQDSINGLGTAVDRWGQLTGQAQVWSLFAWVSMQSVFPQIEIEYADAGGIRREIRRPANVPANPSSYFRLPRSNSRLASYEFFMVAVYWTCSAESLNEQGEAWRAAIFDRVRCQQKSLEAYLQWNIQLAEQNQPSRSKARGIVLKALVFPSPKPDQAERPPSFTIPLARWFPQRDPLPGFLPIEAYDPVTKQFVALPVEEGQ